MSSTKYEIDDEAMEVTDDEADDDSRSCLPVVQATSTLSPTKTGQQSSVTSSSCKSPPTPIKKSNSSTTTGSPVGKSPKSPSAARSASHNSKSSSKRVSPKPSGRTSSSTAIGSGTAKIVTTTTAVATGSATISATAKRKPRSKKKGVTFKKTVGVHTIPNLDTYSITEKELTWYVPDDYGKMEDECDMTAELMDRKRPLLLGLCSRGLEAWTLEGEQRKEGHVQLAIDIVWQAQLEQWKASSDIHECWEFIRSRYLAVSVPCHKIANKRGLSDENEVQAYLSGVRSVERNRLRILGIHQRSTTGASASSSRKSKVVDHLAAAATPRSVTSRTKIGRAHSEVHPQGDSAGETKSPPGRNHSSGNIMSPSKGLLKNSSIDNSTSTSLNGGISRSQNPHVPGGKIKHHQQQQSGAKDSAAHGTSGGDHGDGVSTTSSSKEGGSVASGRKISYQPKSRSKVPVSPVASVMSSVADSDGDSTMRRMRSHMSVASDDSTRRRMLRTAKIKLPL